MAKSRRSGRHAGIRVHRSYTVDEAARTLGIAAVTIRRWIKSGLPALTDQKPALILGPDLIHHLDQRRAPKHRCRPNECYCVKCRVPRIPAANMAEYVPLTATTGNLRGFCPECETLMHKRASKTVLADLIGILDVTVVQAKSPINDH